MCLPVLCPSTHHFTVFVKKFFNCAIRISRHKIHPQFQSLFVSTQHRAPRKNPPRSILPRKAPPTREISFQHALGHRTPEILRTTQLHIFILMPRSIPPNMLKTLISDRRKHNPGGVVKVPEHRVRLPRRGGNLVHAAPDVLLVRVRGRGRAFFHDFVGVVAGGDGGGDRVRF